MPVLIAAGLALLCAKIIYMDLRYMRIPDGISVAAIALFGLWVIIDYPTVPIVAQALTAVIGFAICFVLFALRVMGGGDTKVLPPLLLFIPFGSLPSVMFLFSACLLVSVAAVVVLRKVLNQKDCAWILLKSHKLPMGLAIGSTGMIALLISQI